MAVSDVLAEAKWEIEDYLRAEPEAYEPWKARLEKLVADMEAIRVELDTPPA